jgi:hypothetical protein
MDGSPPLRGYLSQTAELLLPSANGDKSGHGAPWGRHASRLIIGTTGSLNGCSPTVLAASGRSDNEADVVNVEVDRTETHARGVTAEPFGYGPTLIERVAGGWRFMLD